MMSLIRSIGFALMAFLALVASPVGAQPAAPVAASGMSAGTDIANGYKIGADDVIEIDLLGQPDFKTRARVKADGSMQLPYLGTVAVAGETPTGLARKIARLLMDAKLYANPIINVEIASFASRYVIVLGEVTSPGLMPVDRGYRVSEVIARAGGLKDSGANYIIVTRANQPEQKLPFDKLALGTSADDPMVEPGDKVFVPKAETYFVYGQVNSPGEFPVREPLTIRKVIARSGGMTAMGSEKRIKMYHDGNEIKKVSMERVIQGGDVIVVGERLF